MNGKQVIAKLKEAGWQLLRVEGSHHQLGKDGLRTSVPMHGTKDLKPGTLAAIQRQTGVKLK
ncbi:MAG: type II toxin-antitoxin system HicA family toxin [Burkholderiales bacterium]|jgi:predicted RNA binding protein YcfA (HicA-like mRNA interferase family)|nr:type II toxin-antitoxin system HicA family toxin [Burkholderiales bacterium]